MHCYSLLATSLFVRVFKAKYFYIAPFIAKYCYHLMHGTILVMASLDLLPTNVLAPQAETHVIR